MQISSTIGGGFLQLKYAGKSCFSMNLLKMCIYKKGGVSLYVSCALVSDMYSISDIPYRCYGSSALSKCAGSQQFSHLQAIICCLLYTRVPEDPPSRQKDAVLAAHFFYYVASYCKSF